MDARLKKQNENGKSQAQQAPKDGGSSQPSIIEWIVGTVSALLTLAMIGFLSYHAFEKQNTIPQLAVVVEEIRPVDDVYHAAFRIVNEGNATAAGVLVVGELRSGGEVVEEREVTFDYVPSLSERQGALIFENDPSTHNLQIEPHGYSEP
ncbi:TIGR02588 family protein [Chelativorans sp. YIM 93263]|uniref:TIGR02588 family protein n=1 Tax=Chelativorans sp. YIM 93263 TaxID=2906648 RepID=UPI00237A00D7|nr:TIGR02588 family protein [Chelativorans sp. YIM 93263]